MSHSTTSVHSSKKPHHSHRFFLGIELSLWLPIAAIIFLTAGAVGVVGLVGTSSSGRLIALADPYSCSFAPNGGIGCNASQCSECVNGTAVPVAASYCSGMSCGPAPTNTPKPGTPTNTPRPAATNTPTPNVGSGGGGGPTTTPTNTPIPGVPTNTPVPGSATSTPKPSVTKTAVVASPTPTKRPSLFNFSFLPALTAPTPTPAGLANGTACSTNAACRSGQCAPTEFGSYCSDKPTECAPNTKRCSMNETTAVVQTCNSNGYWVVRETCSGGCQDGACVATVCTPNQAVCDGAARKICSADGMSWGAESCAQNTACQQGRCVAESVPLCPAGGSCFSPGEYCTNTTTQKFVCVDGTWKPLLNGLRAAVVGCDQRRTGLYLAGLNDAASLLRSVKYLSVDCAAQNSIFTATTSQDETCRITQMTSDATVRISCQADIPLSEVAHSARREAAMVWVAREAAARITISSFSEAIGCRRQNTSAGIRYVFNKEQPVSPAGRADCTEAFAEAAAMYLEQPCRMKEVYPVQYRFMSTSSDSPLQAAPGCPN